MTWYAVAGINPEPWTAPLGAVVHTKNGPKVGMHKAAALTAYQEAVKAEMVHRYPQVKPFPRDTNVELQFFLWRKQAEYEGEKYSRITKHRADATNLQKALEDALQKVLFVNDSQVVHVDTWIMDQSPLTEPFILIRVSPHCDPPSLAFEMAKTLRPVSKPDDNARSIDTKEVF